MKVQFRFEDRQAMQVAVAIAEEIQNNIALGRQFGTRREHESRPVLLSINGDCYRFEGGIVVKVNLIELSQQEWVVTHATVRFYELDKSFSRVSDQKVEQVWDHDKLLSLKEVRPWWRPQVRDIASINGEVHIFWDNGAGVGYIEVDPDYNQSGHSTSIDCVSYSRFVEGDLERAKAKTRQMLDWMNINYK